MKNVADMTVNELYESIAILEARIAERDKEIAEIDKEIAEIDMILTADEVVKRVQKELKEEACSENS